ncbi:mitochondrial cardiolipin hydrolase-like [Adelges cooleyi]|uniref:mitochondrial cardiolipin hydrolase-like n=1 Tax=Adelges cooleyi TaxID=133065 RepID=UPI00217F6E9A|nr:mitochondrial cardiolipin hydrolase-like [Adelges cooleyi]
MFFKFSIESFTTWTLLTSATALVTYLFQDYMKKKYNMRILFFEPLFYRPKESSCPNIADLVNCLNLAQKSIDVCVYTISSEPLTDAIINAYNRGVLVRVVVSNGVLLYSKEVKKLMKYGVETKFQADYNVYMHNKFAIVDSSTLINGSMNWTHQGAFQNWESVLITNNPSFVRPFNEYFDRVWVRISIE